MRFAVASLAILLAIVAAGCHPSSIFVPSAPTISRCPDVSGVVLVQSMLRVKGRANPLPSGGTAFVVHRDGDSVYGITCHHCVVGLVVGTLRVDNQPATLWAADKDVDLALVRWKSWFPYRVYRFGEPELGQTVWAAGFTETAKDTPGSLFSGGQVRHVRRGTVSLLRHNTLGFDGGASGGFSGGPLLTAEGTVVGISSSVHSIRTVIGRLPTLSFTVAIRPKHAAPLIAAIPP